MISWSPDSLVLGEFRVERPLGEGGFGKVALVRNTRTGDQFAVKRRLVADPLNRAQTIAEMQHWLGLPAHENIVDCYFLRAVGNELAIFAEYVDGGSLADLVRGGGLYQGGSGPALTRILDIAIQTAWGLHALHLFGLVHGDFKAGNVLLTDDDAAKVADFGETTLASQLPKPLTRTPAYASPEQNAGRELNRHTDMWSWAVTVLEMFSGGVSWQSGTVARSVLELRRQEPRPAPIPAIPESVGDLLAVCFQDQPGDRWPAMDRIAAALTGIYQVVCGHEYRRPRPRQPGLEEILEASPLWQRNDDASTQNRAREWLVAACQAEGLDPDTVMDRPASRKTRRGLRLAELAELEQARLILEGAAGGSKSQALSELDAEIGWAHWGLGDARAAVDAFDRSIDQLAGIEEPEARRLRAAILRRQVPLLGTVGRREQQESACDEFVATCELLAADGNEEPRGLLARALSMKAKITADHAAGLELYGRALRLAEEAGDREVESEVLGRMANSLAGQGLVERAASAMTRAEELLSSLLPGDRTEVWLMLATVKMNRSNVALDDTSTASTEAAEIAAVEAVAILSLLVDVQGRHEYTGELGSAHLQAGISQEWAGRPPAARDSYGRARELLQTAVTEDGRSALAERLAEAFNFESTLVRELGDSSAAVELAQGAVRLWQNLVQVDGMGVWEMYLARALCALGANLVAAGELQEGLDRLDEALDVLARLDPPDSRTAQLIAATAHLEAGIAFRRSGDAERAASVLGDGAEIVRSADDPQGLHVRALLLMALSNALDDSARPLEAFTVLDEARSILTGLVEAGHGRWRRDLAFAYQNMTEQLYNNDNLDAAEGIAGAGLELYVTLTAENGNTELLLDMAKLHLGAMKIAIRRHRLPESVRHAASALARLERARPGSERDKLISLMTEHAGFAGPVVDATPDEFEKFDTLAAIFYTGARESADQGKKLAYHEFDHPIGILLHLAASSNDSERLEMAGQMCEVQAIAAFNTQHFNASDLAFEEAASIAGRLVDEYGRADLLEHWSGIQVTRFRMLATYGDFDGAESVIAHIGAYLQDHPAGDQELAAKLIPILAEVRHPTDPAGPQLPEDGG